MSRYPYAGISPTRTEEEQRKWLIQAFEDYRREPYESQDSSAIVLILENAEDVDLVRTTILRWSRDSGMPLRIPHYSVSATAIRRELKLAMGGVLLLEEFGEFFPLTIKSIYDSIKHRHRKNVDILGLDVATADMTKIRKNAEALGANVIDEWGDVLYEPGAAPISDKPSISVVPEDLEVINRHREHLGMRPIDLSMGWSDAELREMAESIRTTGRMANRLKAQLLR